FLTSLPAGRSKLEERENLQHRNVLRQPRNDPEARTEPPCTDKYRLKSITKFPKEDRRYLFEEFWKLGNLQSQRYFMPKYQRKTTKAQWDTETMRQAIKFVENGGSLRQAGKIFNIPESSIRKRKQTYDNGLDVVGPHIGKYQS
ncbi:hypothetical protein NQ318_010589, partial [Aromia moschata]